MFKILGLFIILSSIFGSCVPNIASPDRFGKKLRFSKNVALDLGEFTITFLDKRTISGSTVPGAAVEFTQYFDFKIQNDRVDKIMTWSAENGILRPLRFELDGQKYDLELVRSGKLGPLAEDEIVVWKK